MIIHKLVTQMIFKEDNSLNFNKTKRNSVKALNLGCREIKVKTKCKIILMMVLAPIVLMVFMGISVFGMNILIN